MHQDLELIGKEEYVKAAMGEIIEQYYIANEDCISKKQIQDKIDELKEERKALFVKTYIKREDMIKDDAEIGGAIEVLEELLKGE